MAAHKIHLHNLNSTTAFMALANWQHELERRTFR